MGHDREDDKQMGETALNTKGERGLMRSIDVKIRFAQVEFCMQPESHVYIVKDKPGLKNKDLGSSEQKLLG